MTDSATDSTSRWYSVLTIVGLSVFGVCGEAMCQSFSPARLVALHGSEGLKCPKFKRESRELICQAAVDEDGAVQKHKATHCFGHVRNDLARARILERHVVRSRFEPAKINGEAVSVYASFRVLFLKEERRCRISILPNLDARHDAVASAYFAPQEIITEGSWIDRIAERNQRWTKPGIQVTGMVFSISVAVDVLGRASDGRVEMNGYSPDESVQLAIRALEESRFIPATVDGEPLAARYLELLYLYGRQDRLGPMR